MSSIKLKEILAYAFPVSELPIMHKTDPIRGVYIQGLSLVDTFGRGGTRIAHVTQATITGQRAHIAGPKDITDQAGREIGRASCRERGETWGEGGGGTHG